MRTKHCLFLFYFFITVAVSSQTSFVISEAALAEKIYLQLDDNVYTNTQDVWFKAVVVSAETNIPSQLSRVLYVDLIGPDEKLLEQKLVKIDGGFGNNFFKLQKTYPKGRYLIRAYTEWNKNFGQDFIFKTYINVFASAEKDEVDPIKKLALVKDERGQEFVNIDIDALQLDSLQKRKLNIAMTYNNVRDSLVVKKDKTGNYKFSYKVPENTNVLTLTLETENKIKFTKTISLKGELTDLQFFPESGKMLQNHTNKIGFKAIDVAGVGVNVQGEIVDQNNNTVSKFKSNKLGMGIFALRPSIGNQYFARLTNATGKTKKYSLPPAVAKGSLLLISEMEDKIRISVVSNQLQSERIFIRSTCRGIAYYEIEGKLKNGQLTTTLPRNNFPEGIQVFTLLDNNKQPLAERLFFNELPKERLQIELSADAASYMQRDKTTLDIKILDNDVDSSVYDTSVLVINKELLNKEQNGRQNILSYLLLDSELRGNTENPSYYFDTNNEIRKFELDALLLTQGWRNYKYNTLSKNNFSFKNEPALNVNGRIGIPFSKIKKEGMEISMAVFGENTSFYSQRTDSLGYFDLQIADTYGERAKVLVQNNDKKDKKRNYPIALTKKKPIKIKYEHRPTIKKLDDEIQIIAQKKQNNKQALDAFDRLHGVTQLDEVVLIDRKLTPLQKKVTKKYGEADVVIKGEEIKAKEKKWSYGLYSVLLFNYPGEIEIETFPDGFMLAHVVAGSKRYEATLMMIDGKLVRDYDYNIIPHIPPSEVKSVEIIKYTKRFRLSYMEVFPDAHPLEIPKLGHIISIYTHGNVGLHSVSRPKGQFHTLIPVFSAEKEFYVPKYDTPEELNSNKPDLRSLVYWKPHVKVKTNKKSSVEFYNGDSLGEMLVIVETVSKNGKIGYQELTYSINDKNK